MIRRLALLLVLSAVSEAYEPACSKPLNKNYHTKRVNIPAVVPAGAAGSGPADKRLVCHLEFNATKGRVVEDSSGYANNGNLQGGAIVVSFPKSKCGNAAYTYCGDILFHGDTFQAKPREGITVAVWVNLLDVERSHSLFDTIGVTHPCGQYHFEVNNGGVRWFHRNESQMTVFSCTIDGPHVKQDTWTHIAGTYDSATGKAKIYINGELRNMTIGGGLLSRDWVARAGIGDHKANRPLMGFVDEFRVYNYALTKAEITALVKKCGLVAIKDQVTPPIAAGGVRRPVKDFAQGDADFAINNINEQPLNGLRKMPKTRPAYDAVEEAVLKRSNQAKTAGN